MPAPSSNDILRGSVQFEVVDNPLPQFDLLWIPPANYQSSILYCSFVLTTDANVANRNVTIQIVAPGALTTYRSAPVFVQTAGLTRTYIVSSNTAPNTIIYPLTLQLHLPANNLLVPGFLFRTIIDAMAVGDQISVISLTYVRHALTK